MTTNTSHFATFPPELPRRCIKAGTSERGVCPKCGAPWARATQVTQEFVRAAATNKKHWTAAMPQTRRIDETIGWHPTCGCDAGRPPGRCVHLNDAIPRIVDAPIPATILDPFLGSGTTAMVADQLQRDCIGIELSRKYAAMAEQRVREDNSLFAEIAAQ